MIARRASDKLAYVRVLGDVHGGDRIPDYIKLAKQAEYSIQVGDLSGRDYQFLHALQPSRHRAFTGNHEVFDTSSEWYWRKMKHFLGDYGTIDIPHMPFIFYMRGGFSLNHKRKGLSWSEEEELGKREIDQAIILYSQVEPDIMISHEAPLSVVGDVSNPMVAHNHGYDHSVIRTKTSQGLQAMFEMHKPKIFIFGHYHINLQFKREGCLFVALNIVPEEGCYFDLTPDTIKQLKNEETKEEEIDQDLTDHNNPDHPFKFEIGGNE